MGEIFARERPEQALAFTGERLTTSMTGQIEIEHLHRYFLARELSRGKDVLEIACGEGYGAALLAQVATSVLAIDVSEQAVAHAQTSYRHPALTFQHGDARRIDAADSSRDVVVSFETLEHFREHEEFYAEIRRIMRPGGILIISTLDRDVYSPDGSVANPYHVRELTKSEFSAGLRQVFPHVELLLQRPMIGSLMLADAPHPENLPAVTFEQRGPDAFEVNQGLPRALYLVAYASDCPLQVPSATSYIETSQLAVREEVEIRRVQTLEAERDAARRDAEEQQRIAEAQMHAAQLRVQRIRAEAQRSRAAAEAMRAHAERVRIEGEALLAAMRASTSWRVTAPLRGFKGLLSKQAQAPSDPRLAETPQLPGTNETSNGSQGAAFTPQQASRQRAALGLDLPPPSLSVAVGIVTYDSEPEQLRRCLASAQLALSRTGGTGRLLVIDNGSPSIVPPAAQLLPTQGNLGFGAAHNVLMREAYAAGADLYIATNPDGAFHPDCIDAIARVMTAHDGKALVEASQFPAEHPKVFDPITLNTAWASGACMAIPRQLFEVTGGFDDTFFMYCEDVDLSWMARALGFDVLMAPNALFLHAVTNRTGNEKLRRMMLAAAVLLGRKWGNDRFERLAVEELTRADVEVPLAAPKPVPEQWKQIPDFTQQFSFSAVRW